MGWRDSPVILETFASESKEKPSLLPRSFVSVYPPWFCSRFHLKGQAAIIQMAPGDFTSLNLSLGR
jgi:hypothetical protein